MAHHLSMPFNSDLLNLDLVFLQVSWTLLSVWTHMSYATFLAPLHPFSTPLPITSFTKLASTPLLPLREHRRAMVAGVAILSYNERGGRTKRALHAMDHLWPWSSSVDTLDLVAHIRTMGSLTCVQHNCKRPYGAKSWPPALNSRHEYMTIIGEHLR